MLSFALTATTSSSKYAACRSSMSLLLSLQGLSKRKWRRFIMIRSSLPQRDWTKILMWASLWTRLGRSHFKAKKRADTDRKRMKKRRGVSSNYSTSNTRSKAKRKNIKMKSMRNLGIINSQISRRRSRKSWIDWTSIKSWCSSFSSVRSTGWPCPELCVGKLSHWRTSNSSTRLKRLGQVVVGSSSGTSFPTCWELWSFI